MQPVDTRPSGLQTIDGKTYYFDPETHQKKTGFINAGGVLRYFDPSDGHMLTNVRDMFSGGKVYNIDGSGAVTEKKDNTSVSYQTHVQSYAGRAGRETMLSAERQARASGWRR